MLKQIVTTLPVCVDDAKGKPWKEELGIALQTSIPEAAKAALRKKIRRDDFMFGDLVRDLPVVKHARKRLKKKAVAVRIKGFKLIEKAKASWCVEITWVLVNPAEIVRQEVDDAVLLDEIRGQLSDGWGEGVSQFRFGGAAEDSEDGRFAFNLTHIGMCIV